MAIDRFRSEYGDKEQINRLDKVTVIDVDATPFSSEANKKTNVKNLLKKEIFDIDANTTITASQGQMFFNSTKATGTHDFTINTTSLQVGDTIWIKKSGACDSINLIAGSGVTIRTTQSATEIGDLLTITKIASAVFSCVKIKSNVDNALALKATTTYVNAQDLKSANAEGLFIPASTVDSGVTFTGTSSRTLVGMPRFFTMQISGAGAYTSTSIFNLGYGDYLLRDANGDVIGTTLSAFQYYSCYVDNTAGVIRVLNFTNENAVQTATLSTNDYVVSKNFQRFPNEISIRVSATNPTATPQLSLIVGGASPVLFDIVDQNGSLLTLAVLVPGRLYSLRFNNVTSQYEVQGIF